MKLLTKFRNSLYHQKLLRMRRKHKAIFTILGVSGTVLIWKGVWEAVSIVPVFDQPLISIVAGAVLVVIAGVFFHLA